MGNYYDKEKRLLKAKNDNFIRGTMAEKKKRYTDLYVTITDNLGLGFEDLLSKIEEKMKTTYTKESLSKIINEMNKNFSSSKAEEVLYIVNYGINKDKGDETKMNLYLSKIQEINKKKENVKLGKQKYYNKYKEGKSRSDAVNEKHKEALIKTYEFIDKVVNKEDYTEREFNAKLLFVKKFLKEINKDRYLDFIINHYDVKEISIDELKEIREIVEFFIPNIKNNIDIYSNTDKKDIDKINKLNSMYIKGEEELDDVIKNTPTRLFKWKLNRLKREYEFYCKFKLVLDRAIEDNIFDEYKEYNDIDKNQLKNQYDFIIDINNRIRLFNEIYQIHIKGIKTINQTEYEELDKKYKKRLIKE